MIAHLSPIDFRLARGLQRVRKLVKGCSSDQFRVQESGGVQMGSAAETDIYSLAEKKGILPYLLNSLKRLDLFFS